MAEREHDVLKNERREHPQNAQKAPFYKDALNSEHHEHPYRGVFGRSHVRVTVNAANITDVFGVFAMFGSYS